MFICNSFFGHHLKIAATNRGWGKEMIRDQMCKHLTYTIQFAHGLLAIFFHWVNDTTLIHNVILYEFLHFHAS